MKNKKNLAQTHSIDIFYGFPYSANNQYKDLFSLIVSTIRSYPFVNITRDWYNSKQFLKNRDDPNEKFLETYNETEKAINKADLCIFEITSPSTTLGAQISYAKSLNKTILLLHSNTLDLSRTVFSGIQSENILIYGYSSTSELEKIISSFILGYQQEILDSADTHLRTTYCFSTSKLLDSFDYYGAIVDELRKTDNSIIPYDWLETSIEDRKNNRWRDNETFFKKIDEAINTSDLFFFDLTTPSTSVGMQLSQAISTGKPLLALINNNLTEAAKMYINKLKNSNLQVAPYSNIDELRDHIQKFIQKHRKTQKSRFSVWLPKNLADGMKKYEKETGKSREEILRNFLDSRSL